MDLLRLPIAAHFAWAPAKNDRYLIATGSIAGAMETLDAKSSLDLWSTEVGMNGANAPQRLASVSVADRFECLEWGAVSENDPMGIIAGAYSSGQVALFDPQALLNPSTPSENESQRGSDLVDDDTDSDALLCMLAAHPPGKVSLSFCPGNPLIATGGTDRELKVWNLYDPTAPTAYAMGARTPLPADITAVKWHHKEAAAHIVAAASSDGGLVVWDLRAKRPLTTMRLNNVPSVSCLAWHPINDTHLLIGCGDDARGGVQVRDLRRSLTPLLELKAGGGGAAAQTLGNGGRASYGVLSAAYSPHDSSFLVAGGKDSAVSVLWPDGSAAAAAAGGPVEVPGTQGCRIGSLAPASHWVHDIRWAPHTPGVLAYGVFGECVRVVSVAERPAEDALLPRVPVHAAPAAVTAAGAGTQSSVVGDAAVLRPPPPTWLRVGAGCDVAMGGLVASVLSEDGRGTKVRLQRSAGPSDAPLPTQPLEALLSALQTNEREPLRDFCREASCISGRSFGLDTPQQQIASTAAEAALWDHLAAAFVDAPRAELRALYGFDEDAEAAAASAFVDARTHVGASAPEATLSLDTTDRVRRLVTVGQVGAAARVAACVGAYSDALTLSSLAGEGDFKSVRNSFISSRTSATALSRSPSLNARHPGAIASAAAGASFKSESMEVTEAVASARKQLYELVGAVLARNIRPLIEDIPQQQLLDGRWREVAALVHSWAPSETFSELLFLLGTRLLDAVAPHASVSTKDGDRSGPPSPAKGGMPVSEQTEIAAAAVGMLAAAGHVGKLAEAAAVALSSKLPAIQGAGAPNARPSRSDPTRVVIGTTAYLAVILIASKGVLQSASVSSAQLITPDQAATFGARIAQLCRVLVSGGKASLAVGVLDAVPPLLSEAVRNSRSAGAVAAVSQLANGVARGGGPHQPFGSTADAPVPDVDAAGAAPRRVESEHLSQPPQEQQQQQQQQHTQPPAATAAPQQAAVPQGGPPPTFSQSDVSVVGGGAVGGGPAPPPGGAPPVASHPPTSADPSAGAPGFSQEGYTAPAAAHAAQGTYNAFGHPQGAPPAPPTDPNAYSHQQYQQQQHQQQPPPHQSFDPSGAPSAPPTQPPPGPSHPPDIYPSQPSYPQPSAPAASHPPPAADAPHAPHPVGGSAPSVGGPAGEMLEQLTAAVNEMSEADGGRRKRKANATKSLQKLSSDVAAGAVKPHHLKGLIEFASLVSRDPKAAKESMKKLLQTDLSALRDYKDLNFVCS